MLARVTAAAQVLYRHVSHHSTGCTFGTHRSAPGFIYWESNGESNGTYTRPGKHTKSYGK